MAANYTDGTDADFTTGNYNIDTGKNLSAAGVRNALHTKENVANKQVSSTNDTADVLDASSSDDYYPSSKLAGKNFAALRSGKQDKIAAGTANDIVAYSGTEGTFNTLTRTTTLETNTISASDEKIPTEKAVADALSGKASSSDLAAKQDKIEAGTANDILTKTAAAGTLSTLTKKTSIRAEADAEDTCIPTEKAVATALNNKENTSNKVTAITVTSIEDTAKYPTVGAVTAWATTELMDILLPVGTIIAMHNKTYYNTANAAFKTKWKVCDGTSGTPNLTNLFLRGMSDGGTDAVGGDSVTLTSSHLPSHTHTVSVTEPNSGKGHRHPAMQQHYSGQGNPCLAGGADTTPHDNDWWYSTGYAKADLVISVTGGGGSPQTAVSIVPKYYAVIYIMKVA
ncbi:phage tail collar domain [Candidatus Termititenax aidoneus]|uniref:Phage tail collar domain n=1 Tax=Termititenax aidoneus TaxID=2218524 RepID=A0A388TB83_TERA1|nr:phage tail collar domain [Candidatus Termititenax aidoneus]